MTAMEWLMPAMERRFQPRATVELAAQYRRAEAGLWQPALIRDLSGGGTAALLDESLALGTALTGFRFMVPDENGGSEWPLAVSVQVVRCVPAPEAEKPFLARFQFLQPSPREVQTLRRYVHRLLHGDAADRIPIEIPPYEIAAKASAENRLARRLESARREGAALERDLTSLGAEAARAGGALDKRIAALQDVLYAAVETEERLRAEIRRLAEGRRRQDDKPSDETLEQARQESAEITRKYEAARWETAELRRRLEESARDLEKAAAERSKLEAATTTANAKAADRIAGLETELATVSSEMDAMRVEERERQLAVLSVERPLRPPSPVRRDAGWGPELASLAAGLILGALAVLGWQRLVQSPAPELAGRPALAEPPTLEGQTESPMTATAPIQDTLSEEPAATVSERAGTLIPAAEATVTPPRPDPAVEAIRTPPAASAPARRPATEPGALVAQEPPSPEPVEDDGIDPAPISGESARPDAGAIVETVESWAAAWTDQRIEDFFALYDEGFEPPSGVSRAAWEAGRRESVLQPPWVRVSVNRLRYKFIAESRVLVDFDQLYETESQRVDATNTLELSWTGSSWKILREHRGALGRSPM